VINEAALLTARTNGKQISMAAMEEAIDRVMAGPERKSAILSEKERKIIAYHEAATPSSVMRCQTPTRCTRSRSSRATALGYTQALPTEDKVLVTRAEMWDQLAMLLGGAPPRSWFSTSPPPVPRTTSRRPARSPAGW